MVKLVEYRCPICKRLFFKGIICGIIEIKCTKCKKIHKIEVEDEGVDVVVKLYKKQKK